MNILIYNWRDIKNPDAGGAEVFTHENAKRWVEMGHTVTWFTATFPGCNKEEMNDGIKLVRAGNKYSVYMKAREYYKKYFSKQMFDIVIDEINTIPFFTPDFVKNGERIVVLIHQLAREFWFYETPLPAAILGRYFLENHWLKKYRNIPTMTVSNSTKQDLIELGFRNITIVLEGIKFTPLESVPEKEKEPTFVFVGRLKKAKKPQDAIKAFTLAKRTIPSAKLWVIGDGYHRKELEESAGNDVTFFGRIPENEKLNLISRAHAILVPGVREGWGLVVTEANACGTPAIAYNVHGLRDSVQCHVNGILVDATPEKMTLAMIALMSNKASYEKLLTSTLIYSRDFSWDNSAKHTINIMGTYL